jgi:hypothetical protein
MATFEELPVGTIIRTRTGKLDAIVVGGVSAEDKEAAISRYAAGLSDWTYTSPTASIHYRSLKNGKPFGPERSADPETLTAITATP